MFRNDLVRAPKPVPKFCDELCSRYGRNPFGENLYRVVYLPDRVFCNGGYWTEHGLFQYLRQHRYGVKPTWGLERWVPAKAFGSSDTWAERTMVNGEGKLEQGSFPMRGSYICVVPFVGNLTFALVSLTLRELGLGDLKKMGDTRDSILMDAAEKDRLWEEAYDRDWEEIDSPRRGLSYTAGGKRVNQHDNDVLKKETEIAAVTGGKFREAKSGFGQMKDLKELENGT